MDKISETVYNCIDCLATSRIYEEMIREDRNRQAFRFDQAILGPAITMQLRGIRVDQDRMRQADLETSDLASDLHKRFEAVCPVSVKWGKSIKPSPIQLAKILYGEMGVRVRTSKEGSPTVNKEAIAAILEDPRTPEEAVRVAEIAQELAILEEDQKILRKPLREDGRLHTTWVPAGATTGRFGAKQDHFDYGFNLQAFSHRLHKICIPDPGYVLINIDQKQAESRGVAFLANCKKYKEMHFRGNVHVQVGQWLYPETQWDSTNAKKTELPWDQGKSYYDLFKKVQHSSNYGESPYGMARQLHMKTKEAEKLQARYFSELPEIRDWQAEIAQQLKIYHTLTTPLGRSRLFLGRTWDDSLVKEAIAYVPQSMISQLNKVILWRIWNRFDPHHAQILLEGHDSVTFQVRQGDTETVEEILALACIEVPIRGDVMPVEMEAQWGWSWGKEDLQDYQGKLS